MKQNRKCFKDCVGTEPTLNERCMYVDNSSMHSFPGYHFCFMSVHARSLLPSNNLGLFEVPLNYTSAYPYSASGYIAK